MSLPQNHFIDEALDRLPVRALLFDPQNGEIVRTGKGLDGALEPGKRIVDTFLARGNPRLEQQVEQRSVAAAGWWGAAWSMRLDSCDLPALVLEPLPFPLPDVWMRVIGGFDLRAGGELVAQGPQRDRLTELLLTVALGMGRPVSRLTAGQQLWPREVRSVQRENLKQLLRRVPQLSERLGLSDGVSPLVSSAGGGLLLNQDAVGFDLLALAETRSFLGRHALAGNTCVAARLAEAVMMRIFSRRSGGILTEDIEQTPALREQAAQLEWGIGALSYQAGVVMAQEGRDDSLVELMRVAMRNAPNSPYVALYAINAAVWTGQLGFAREAYSVYEQQLESPMSWDEVMRHVDEQPIWGSSAAATSPR